MTPPERLRTELERLRDRGYSFKSAWPVAMSHALEGEPLDTAVFWRRTFSQQRPIWGCSYSGVPWPANRRPALFVPDRDGSQPAARTRVEVAV